MRVDLVSEHASPLAVLGGVDAGGQNVHVASLAVGLARAGHAVRVHTRRDAADLPERVPLAPGVEVVHLAAGPARHVPKDDLLPHVGALGDALLRDWEAHGAPDVVHSHFWMSGLAAARAADAAAVPLVHTYHALGSVKRRHQGTKDTSPEGRVAAELAVGRRADLVVATCSDEVDELVRLGVPAERVRVVPCGVDVEHFRPLPAARLGAVPPGVPVRERRHRLLVVGRLVERKGVDTVVRALAARPGTSLADTELLVAGGPVAAALGADPEARRLRDLAASLGVADRVHLVGQVAHDDLTAVIGSSDLVVATPWYEPFGIVPLEAAACGVPLVGSAVGGLLDSVAPGVTGALVPPRDAGALADALVDLLDDEPRRRAMGRAARRRAVARYSWSRVAAQTASHYRSLTGGGLARPVPARLTEVAAV
ncbi:glycosyltransferase [Cellulomonas endophytica]|uniref:glycosyltransferase n=1 Tax=Cellulomonas endophytica TaxID=2494735 RepID=UPI001013722D|nr:glycosyltransferase [Cellulomonas endophytica]